MTNECYHEYLISVILFLEAKAILSPQYADEMEALLRILVDPAEGKQPRCGLYALICPGSE